MPRHDFFVPYLLPGHVKYCVNSQIKLSAILKHAGKNFVMMMSIVRLSSNRYRREPIKMREYLANGLLYKGQCTVYVHCRYYTYMYVYSTSPRDKLS